MQASLSWVSNSRPPSCPEVVWLSAQHPAQANAVRAVPHTFAGLSEASPEVLLPLGACLMGFGGLSYHVSQFNTAQLFPSRRGFVSSLFVGMFIASGIVFETVRAAFQSTSGRGSDYRAILLGLAAITLPFSLLMAWMAPRKAFQAGDRYRFDRQRFAFVVQPAAALTHEAKQNAGLGQLPPAGEALAQKAGVASRSASGCSSVEIHDPSAGFATTSSGTVLHVAASAAEEIIEGLELKDGKPRRRSMVSVADMDGPNAPKVASAESDPGVEITEVSTAPAAAQESGGSEGGAPLPTTGSRRPVHARCAPAVSPAALLSALHDARCAPLAWSRLLDASDIMVTVWFASLTVESCDPTPSLSDGVAAADGSGWHACR